MTMTAPSECCNAFMWEKIMCQQFFVLQDLFLLFVCLFFLPFFVIETQHCFTPQQEAVTVLYELCKGILSWNMIYK